MASRTTSWAQHTSIRNVHCIVQVTGSQESLYLRGRLVRYLFGQTAPQQCRGPGAPLGSWDVAHMETMRLWAKAKVVAMERRGRTWETEEINKQPSVTNGVGLGRDGAQLVASHTPLLTNRNTRPGKKRVKQGFRAKWSHGIQPF